MNGTLKSAVSLVFALALSTVSVAAFAADKSSSKADNWPSFKKVDADNNGAISMDEARSVPGLADSFTQYDKNSDGQLSQSEYESAKKAIRKSSDRSMGSPSSDSSSPPADASKEGVPSSTGAGSQTR
jgi:hypothetical protein